MDILIFILITLLVKATRWSLSLSSNHHCVQKIKFSYCYIALIYFFLLLVEAASSVETSCSTEESLLKVQVGPTNKGLQNVCLVMFVVGKGREN